MPDQISSMIPQLWDFRILFLEWHSPFHSNPVKHPHSLALPSTRELKERSIPSSCSALCNLEGSGREIQTNIQGSRHERFLLSITDSLCSIRDVVSLPFKPILVIDHHNIQGKHDSIANAQVASVKEEIGLYSVNELDWLTIRIIRYHSCYISFVRFVIRSNSSKRECIIWLWCSLHFLRCCVSPPQCAFVAFPTRIWETSSSVISVVSIF